ncbi:MAG: AI-2E family transporter [Bacteroidales bacterium]|nr:AI-2E family transporter [Bacteroidales bacterium]
MASKLNPSDKQENNYVNIAIDLVLKVGALFLVVFLCFKIINPFISILLWGLIIAIILFPLFQRLNHWLGERIKLSSLIIMVIGLSLLVLPSVWLVNQLVDGVKILADSFQEGNLTIPVPPESVSDWPLIGQWLYGHWLGLSEDFGESVKGFMPQITAWGEKLLSALANTGLGILQFAVSIIIAGIFLIFFEKGSNSGRKIFQKVVGDRGEEFLNVSLVTIRNVAAGVLGVAIIQSTLIGVGLFFANIPLAAVWIIVVLVMSIAQIPVLLFNIPLIIYLFAFLDPLPAVLWSVYFIIMGLIDNILKPIIMGKGSDVPMLVIFLGAIGGFMAFGFIGLFLGAIILSLAYKLYVTWVSYE